VNKSTQTKRRTRLGIRWLDLITMDNAQGQRHALPTTSVPYGGDIVSAATPNHGTTGLRDCTHAMIGMARRHILARAWSKADTVALESIFRVLVHVPHALQYYALQLCSDAMCIQYTLDDRSHIVWLEARDGEEAWQRRDHPDCARCCALQFACWNALIRYLSPLVEGGASVAKVRASDMATPTAVAAGCGTFRLPSAVPCTSPMKPQHSGAVGDGVSLASVDEEHEQEQEHEHEHEHASGGEWAACKKRRTAGTEHTPPAREGSGDGAQWLTSPCYLLTWWGASGDGTVCETFLFRTRHDPIAFITKRKHLAHAKMPRFGAQLDMRARQHTPDGRWTSASVRAVLADTHSGALRKMHLHDDSDDGNGEQRRALAKKRPAPSDTNGHIHGEIHTADIPLASAVATGMPTMQQESRRAALPVGPAAGGARMRRRRDARLKEDYRSPPLRSEDNGRFARSTQGTLLPPRRPPAPTVPSAHRSVWKGSCRIG